MWGPPVARMATASVLRGRRGCVWTTRAGESGRIEIFGWVASRGRPANGLARLHLEGRLVWRGRVGRCSGSPEKKNGSKISSTLENMTSSFERTTSAPSGRTKVKSGCSTILLKFKLAMKSSHPWVTLCEITADAPEVERCSSGDLQ